MIQPSEVNIIEHATFRTENRAHLSGNILYSSELVMLNKDNKNPLLITPFYNLYDDPPGILALFWNPKTMKLLGRFIGEMDNMWKLWGNYYLIIREDSETRRKTTIWIYRLHRNRLQRIRRIFIFIGMRALITAVLTSKLFKNIYLITSSTLRIIDKDFALKASERPGSCIVKAFICEEFKALVTCSWNFTSIHHLDDMGDLEKLSAYKLEHKHKLVTACLNSCELTVITINETDQTNNMYVARYELARDTFKEIEPERHLNSTCSWVNYYFSFLPNTKAVVCRKRESSLFYIVSVETGKVLFESDKYGVYLKMDPKERTLYTNNDNMLHKLVFDEDGFFKDI